MECNQARQLFDAYLDGELSKALVAELDAHRVRCEDCRRDLALLEVTGHVISCDKECSGPRDGFTDRLLACMENPRTRWSNRFRRSWYVGVPIAAAAVIALAFLGMFDRRPTVVAGQKEVAPAGGVIGPAIGPANETVGVQRHRASDGAETNPAWVRDIPESLDTKRQSVESLQGYFDLTILQWLDMLNAEQANHEKSKNPVIGEPPKASAKDQKSKKNESKKDKVKPDPDEDVEDL